MNAGSPHSQETTRPPTHGPPRLGRDDRRIDEGGPGLVDEFGVSTVEAGATGVGVTTRGLKVALVERDDFGSYVRLKKDTPPL